MNNHETCTIMTMGTVNQYIFRILWLLLSIKEHHRLKGQENLLTEIGYSLTGSSFKHRNYVSICSKQKKRGLTYWRQLGNYVQLHPKYVLGKNKCGNWYAVSKSKWHRGSNNMKMQKRVHNPFMLVTWWAWSRTWKSGMRSWHTQPHYLSTMLHKQKTTK